MALSSAAQLNRVIQFLQKAQVFLARGPVYHYTYGRWRLDGWWHKKTDGFANMQDVTFLGQVDLRQRGLSNVEGAVAREDWRTAQSELAAYFCARSQPQFHFGWKDKEKILSVIGDEQKEATIQAADQVCQNIFCFRRAAPVKFEKEIDWTCCPEGNTDWRWDLNRHPYFITLGKAYWYTGDEKYAAKFTELLLDWIDKNPAGVERQNWNSVLEVAVRLNTWVWAYFFFRQAKAFGQHEHTIFLQSLLTHAHYLAVRIERHAANNHLLLEAKALAFFSILFPEFKEAREWQESALRILWNEVEKQICTDGVHAERAPLYHRRILSDLLEMLVLLENNDLPAPGKIVNRIEKMLNFDAHIAKPDGTIPLFGDSALTEIQTRFSSRGVEITSLGQVRLDASDVDEDMAWLLGNRNTKPGQAPGKENAKLVSRAFPEGGYFVMRGGADGKELYLAFDCGPFGYEPVPVHGHADALSFDLYTYGHSMITDCGVYSYHLGKDWRSYFISTRAHNTIVVDGKDQSVLLESGHVYRMAHATLHHWTSHAHFDFVDGSHDGYCRLKEPVTHRRKIFFVKPEYWIIVDLLLGRGQHRLEQYFHLMPWAIPVLDPQTLAVHVQYNNTLMMSLVPLNAEPLEAQFITGATDPVQGWVSFFSGEKAAAPVLRYCKDAQVPISFVTVLYPYEANTQDKVHVAGLSITTRDGEPIDEMAVSGLTVETADYVDICVVAHEGAPSWMAFAGYESDGQLVYVRRRKNDRAVVRMIMRGGHTLSFQGRSLVAAQGLERNFALDGESVIRANG